MRRTPDYSIRGPGALRNNNFHKRNPFPAFFPIGSPQIPEAPKNSGGGLRFFLELQTGREGGGGAGGLVSRKNFLRGPLPRTLVTNSGFLDAFLRFYLVLIGLLQPSQGASRAVNRYSMSLLAARKAHSVWVLCFIGFASSAAICLTGNCANPAVKPRPRTWQKLHFLCWKA